MKDILSQSDPTTAAVIVQNISSSSWKVLFETVHILNKIASTQIGHSSVVEAFQNNSSNQTPRFHPLIDILRLELPEQSTGR